MISIKSYEVCRAHVKDRRHLSAYETLWINRTKGCCNVLLPIGDLKKEQKKEWYKGNKDKVAEKNKQWRGANKRKSLSIRDNII